MAKKRLNKRLLMTLALFLMALLVVAVFLGLKYWRGDPDEALANARLLAEQGRAEAASVKEQADNTWQESPQDGFADLQKKMDEIRQGAWQEAVNQYAHAYTFAVRRKQETVALNTLQELANLYREMNAWPQAMNVWQRMLQFQRTDATLELHYTARREMAQYGYTRAKIINRYWQEVATQAQELIKLKDQEVLGYTMKAHAQLALVASREVQEVEQAMTETASLLDKALQFDENSVEAYYLLGLAELLRQDQTTDKNLQQEHAAKAEAYSRAAVSKNPDDPEAYLNLYRFWSAEVRRHYERAVALRREMVETALRARQDQTAQQAMQQAVRTLEEAENLEQALQQVISALTQAAQSLANTSAPAQEDLGQTVKLLEQSKQDWRPIKQNADPIIQAIGEGIPGLLVGPQIVAELLQSTESMQPEMLTQTSLAQAREIHQLVRLLGELTKCIQLCQDRFPNDGRFYRMHAQLMQSGRPTQEALSAAIDLGEKSLTCPEAESGWYADVADLYQRRSDFADVPPEDLTRAFELLNQGLYLPEMSLEKAGGPDMARIQRARLVLLQVTVGVCARLAMAIDESDLKQEYLTTGQACLTQLKERIPSESSAVKMAEGSLALAQGNRDQAVSCLYQADVSLATQDLTNINVQRNQAWVAWYLFEALRGHDQAMAALAYGHKALVNRYMEGNRRQREAAWLKAVTDELAFPYLADAIDRAQDYVQTAKDDDPYLTDVLLAQAKVMLALGQLDDARDVLEKIQGQSPELNMLRARALANLEDRVQALEELAVTDPANPILVRALYAYYMSKGPSDAAYYDKASTLVKTAQTADPDNPALSEMDKILTEPDPNVITEQRLAELRLEVLQEIPDTFKRELALGSYYHRLAEAPQAQAPQEPAAEEAQLNEYRATAQQHYEAAAQVEAEPGVEAYSRLFDLALLAQDLQQAENWVQTIIKKDRVQGLWCQARLQAARKDYQEAANDVRSYLAERPIAPQARVFLAQMLMQQGQLEDAIEQAKEAVAQDMAGVPGNGILAHLLHRYNENRQADPAEWTLEEILPVVQALDRVLQRAPQNPDALHLKVFYYPLLIDRRIEQLRSLPNIRPEVLQELLHRVETTYASTVRTLQESVTDRSDRVRNWVSLARLPWQYAAQLEPLASSLAAQAQRATDTSRRDALNRLAEQLATRAKQLREETEQVYKAALQANPKSADLTEVYANHLRNLGQVEQAEALYQKILAQATDPQDASVKLRLAQQFLGRGQSDRAKTLVQEILDTDPANRDARALLAEIHVQQRDYADALTIFEQLRKEQDSPNLLIRQIQVLLTDNQFASAAALIAQLKQEYPDQEGAPLLEASSELSQGNYAAAAAFAAQIIGDEKTTDRLKVEASLLQAEAFFFDRKYNQAETSLKTMRSLARAGDTRERVLLAQVYWAQGRRDDAIAQLKRTLEDSPGWTKAQQQLLQYLKEDNRWAEIQSMYQDALAAAPDSADRHIAAARALAEYGQVEQRAARELNAQDLFSQALKLMKRAW